MFPDKCWYEHFFLFWYVELVPNFVGTFQSRPVQNPVPRKLYSPFSFEWNWGTVKLLPKRKEKKRKESHSYVLFESPALKC
jgi:hypothetical protein